jgi:6-phosphogluconolactonase
MLTGGNSAEKLYMDWAKLKEFRDAKGISFFFGDERCVSSNHPDSNYGMTMRTLFSHGVPEGCSVFRMEADDHDPEAAALRYDRILDINIDVLLLGVGEDGHVASLFPGSPTLLEKTQRVVATSGPKPPNDRLTITVPVITQARRIFVLAPGKNKAMVLAKAQQDTDNISVLPARLLLDATWLLDFPLYGDSTFV